MDPRRKSPIFRPVVCLCLAFFLLAALHPAGAAAYIARSGGGGTAYGIARSQPGGASAIPLQPVTPPPDKPAPEPAPAPVPQPVPEPSPPPAPPAGEQPVYQVSGSHGIARSGSVPVYRSQAQATAPASAPAPAPSPPPAQAPPPSSPAPPPPGSGGTALNAQEQRLLNLVNAERSRRGLTPLQVHPTLTYLARLKSRDMIDNNYFAHRSPVYGSVGDMLRSAGIPYSLAAENIGVGGNIDTIFYAFMNSSGHRNKILDSRYLYTGIGVFYQPGRGYLVTQIFLSPR